MTDHVVEAHRGTYRSDIDGLRAVAVLSVVAFHVGFAWFGGGFVGVDIFFVISGYLITQILLREIVSTGRVRMLEFYARRVRRLFPALAVVVLATLVAGHFFLLPIDEQPDLARSTYASAGYVSNVYFSNAANDYFAGPAEEQPLLHLWSLAVEEQYYLGWPALIFGLWWAARRLRLDQRRAVLGAVGLLTIASFVLCVVLTARAPGIAFYYLPTRAWELGVGSLLAIGLERVSIKSSQIGNVLTGGGLLALLAAVTVVDEAMPFPGAIAALPVLGAALCIAGGSFGSSLGDRVLGNRPMVWVGRLSYSLYLWHWPMLAIARTDAVAQPNPARDVLLAIGAVGLAWATLVFVENPIRYRRPGPFARKGTTLLAGGAISLTMALGGFVLAQGAIIQAREPAYAELLAVSTEASLLGDRCQSQRVPLIDRTECTLPGADGTREYVVWGDSHSDRALVSVAGVARLDQIPVVQRTHPSCPPLLGVTPSSSTRRPNSTCARFNTVVFEELEAEAAAGKQIVIVLVARWPNYLETTSPSGDPGLTLFDTSGQGNDSDVAAVFEGALERTVTQLEAIGIRSVIVAPVPEFRSSPPICRIRLPSDGCGITRFEAEEYRSWASAVIQRISSRHPETVAVVDAFDGFCDLEFCDPVKDGQLAYADQDHLTYTASAALAPEFAFALEWGMDQPMLASRANPVPTASLARSYNGSNGPLLAHWPSDREPTNG